MLTIGTQKIAGSFNYFSGLGDPSPTGAGNFVQSVDLDGDGVDEVIFYGFETQPNTPATYSNTKITIFGWSNGAFKDITNNWLPGGVANIEAAASICFGDFNNDGRIDFFTGAGTDMNLSVNAYEFLNIGGSFARKTLSHALGNHDSAAADINDDGYCDVVATGYYDGQRIYLGGPNGLTEHLVNNFMGGSGVALGDFLGDGTVTMVLTDHHPPSGNDTSLHKFVKDSNGEIYNELIASLPPARFDQPLYNLPEYGKIDDPWGHSHDIRAIPLDFDSDGLLDVIVISVPKYDLTNWTNYTEVQFLKNLGSGNFSDVTSDVLKNYVKESDSCYTPKLGDFNGDGLTDIFLSEGSWEPKIYNSTSILLQNADGTFVDSYRKQLSKLVQNGGGKAAIAVGPNDTKYLISVFQKFGGDASVKYAPLNFYEKINGTSNDEDFNGSGGNDKIDGQAGIDTIKYLNTKNNITVNLSKGKAYSSDATNSAGVGTDTLKNIENVVSGGYSDTIIGNKLNNVLNGGSGNDTIDGGLSNDTLIGGLGSDVFVFSSKISAMNADIIEDYATGDDKIQLSSKIFTKLKGAADYLCFGANSDTPIHYLIYDITTGKLFYDVDGNGSKAQVEIVEIGVGVNLQSNDIFIV